MSESRYSTLRRASFGNRVRASGTYGSDFAGEGTYQTAVAVADYGMADGRIARPIWANAVYATIDAVETFVDHHYQEQIDRLAPAGEFADLRELLLKCQQDEVAHRDEARHLTKSKPGAVLSCWRWLVGTGSSAAVLIARRF